MHNNDYCYFMIWTGGVITCTFKRCAPSCNSKLLLFFVKLKFNLLIVDLNILEQMNSLFVIVPFSILENYTKKKEKKNPLSNPKYLLQYHRR